MRQKHKVARAHIITNFSSFSFKLYFALSAIDRDDQKNLCVCARVCVEISFSPFFMHKRLMSSDEENEQTNTFGPHHMMIIWWKLHKSIIPFVRRKTPTQCSISPFLSINNKYLEKRLFSTFLFDIEQPVCRWEHVNAIDVSLEKHTISLGRDYKRNWVFFFFFAFGESISFSSALLIMIKIAIKVLELFQVK